MALTLSLLAAYVCYLLAFVLFWAPGLFIADTLVPRSHVGPYRHALAFVVSCLIGYAAFWLYLASVTIASLVCTALLLTSIALACGHRPTRTVLLHDRLILITFLVGLMYLSIHFLSGTGHPLDLPRDRYFEGRRSLDTSLPFDFAQAVIDRDASLHAGHFSGWHFSERPPLETGVVLAFWPLGRIFDIGVVYQCIGTTLQLGWVMAFSLLAAACGFAPRKTDFILALTAFSGFVFYNCIFLWPKMLAGALFLAALAPALFCLRERRRFTLAEVMLSSLALALAFLAHGGVAFSLLGLTLVGFALAPRVIAWRQIAALGALSALLYAPWLAYQRWYDPNPGLLAKAHLAGVLDPDDHRPLLRATVDAYRDTPPRDLVSARLDNFRTLLGDFDVYGMTAEIVRGMRQGNTMNLSGPPTVIIEPYRFFHDRRSLATILRMQQREYLVPALAWLNIGWIFLAIACFSRSGWQSEEQRATRVLLLWTLVTIGAWCLLEFLATSTIATHASYAMMLCLFFLTGAGLWHSPGIVRGVVSVLHVATFVWLWVVSLPGYGAMHMGMDADEVYALPTIMGAVSAVALLAVLFPDMRAQVVTQLRAGRRRKRQAGAGKR